MGNALLPCPFCGSDKVSVSPPTCRPETPYNPADRLYPLASCRTCQASVPGDNEDYEAKSAVAAWNRRADLIALDTPYTEYRVMWHDPDGHADDLLCRGEITSLEYDIATVDPAWRSRVEGWLYGYYRGLKVAGHPGEDAFEVAWDEVRKGRAHPVDALLQIRDYAGPENDDVRVEVDELLRAATTRPTTLAALKRIADGQCECWREAEWWLRNEPRPEDGGHTDSCPIAIARAAIARTEEGGRDDE